MELSIRVFSQGLTVDLSCLKARKLLSIVVATLLFAAGICGVLALHTQARQALQGDVVTPAASSLARSGVLPASTLTAAVTLSKTSTVIAGCSDNNAGKLLVVSVSQQHIWACDGTQTVNDSAVTTGANDALRGVDDGTPTGTFSIRSKVTDTTLRDCDINGCWDDVVQYWMPFDGEVGFHDASWQTFPFGSSEYHTNGSHGCVHLPTSMAAWVYGWASVGTTVVVNA
jgi:hypothetical protein